MGDENGTTQQPRLRADALRNRQQILSAARELFATTDPEQVPLEDVAKAAGVGIATFYRRFPDRNALIHAVAEENFHRVLGDATEAIREEPDAWHALLRFFRHTTEIRLLTQLTMLSRRARGVVDADDDMWGIRKRLLSHLDDLVQRCQREGSMREDVGAGDVTVALSMLLLPVEGTRSELGIMLTDRTVAILLDGLQARPGSPLPGHAVHGSEVQHPAEDPP